MNEANVFISWSGQRSQAIAKCIKDWLPDVVRGCTPWMSSEDLRKGLPWLAELNKQLSDSSIGLIIVTNDNKDAPWLLFEAGVLSKALSDKHCCPVLADLKSTDLSGPLAQFQSTALEREDMLRLVRTINSAGRAGIVDEVRLKKWFDQSWPELDARCAKALEAPRAGKNRESRSDRELLEEAVTALRHIVREGADATTLLVDRQRIDTLFSPNTLLELFASLPTRLQQKLWDEMLSMRRRIANPEGTNLGTGTLSQAQQPSPEGWTAIARLAAELETQRSRDADIGSSEVSVGGA